MRLIRAIRQVHNLLFTREELQMTHTVKGVWRWVTGDNQPAPNVPSAPTFDTAAKLRGSATRPATASQGRSGEYLRRQQRQRAGAYRWDQNAAGELVAFRPVAVTFLQELVGLVEAFAVFIRRGMGTIYLILHDLPRSIW